MITDVKIYVCRPLISLLILLTYYLPHAPWDCLIPDDVGPIGCTQNVTDYQSKVRNIPEERRFQ